MKKSKYKELFSNIGLITLGNFSSKLLIFFLIPFYTRVLTTSEYGTSDLIFTTISLLYPLFTVLMTEAIMRFSLDEMYNKKQIFSIAVYISLIGLIVLFIFSPVMLLFSAIKNYYLYFLIYYFLYIFDLLFLQFAKGINKVKVYSIAGILNTFVTVMCNILFLTVLKLGLDGYFLAYIAGLLVSSGYMVIKNQLWKYLISPKKINKTVIKEMLSFSIPMIPNSISWWISNSSDKYLLSYLCSVSVNGIYSISYKIPSIITVISNIFMGAWQISSVDNFGSEENKKFYSTVYKNYSSLLIIIISFLVLFLKIIAKFIFAKEFYIAWECSIILLLAALFNSKAAFLGTIYTSAKKTRFLFVSTLLGAMTNIVLNIILIPLYEAKGAAIATLISYLIVWLARLINSRNILKISINLKKDLISYVLIVIQIVIYIFNIKFSFIINFVILLVILFINKNTLISLANTVLSSKRLNEE